MVPITSNLPIIEPNPNAYIWCPYSLTQQLLSIIYCVPSTAQVPRKVNREITWSIGQVDWPPQSSYFLLSMGCSGLDPKPCVKNNFNLVECEPSLWEWSEWDGNVNSSQRSFFPPLGNQRWDEPSNIIKHWNKTLANSKWDTSVNSIPFILSPVVYISRKVGSICKNCASGSALLKWLPSLNQKMISSAGNNYRQVLKSCL